MAELAFVRIIAVAAVMAILAQCLVYAVRRWWGMAAALRVMRGSLSGFVLVTVGALIWSWANGDLPAALVRFGIRPVIDMAMFVGFTMFVSYFMGSRYLADELERAKARDSSEGSGSRG